MIQILDKTFEPFLSEAEIQEAVASVARRMEADLCGKKPLFVCILKGALFFFADLLEEIHFSYDIAFYRVSSYDGTQSSNKIEEKMPFPGNLAGRTVVIVEDIVETGNTIAFIAENFLAQGAKEVRIAALFFKPYQYHGTRAVEYVGKNIGDEFIVGYGLDYNQAGRNLPEIYRLPEEK